MSAAPLPEKCVIAFDLDDTLYPEREFVCSGFRAISGMIDRQAAESVYQRLIELFDQQWPDPFGAVLAERGLSIDKQQLIATYRDHRPNLTLAADVEQLLTDLRSSGRSLAIITDGRSRTQRNKIQALGLDKLFDMVLISEEFGSAKPAEQNYRRVEQRFPGRPCRYVGDNPAKDFVAPNHLGWTTFCVLDGGQNIHPQDFDNAPKDRLPHYLLERLA